MLAPPFGDAHEELEMDGRAGELREAEARPHLIFVRAGSLDKPEIARPAATIWTSQAPSWACFDPKLPIVERQPPPAA